MRELTKKAAVRAKALPEFVEVLRTGGAGADGGRGRCGLKPCLGTWKSCGLAGRVAGRAKALPEYVEVLRTGGASRVYPTSMR